MGIDEPQAHRFGKQQHDDWYQGVDVHARAKHPMQARRVAAPKLEVEVALRGRSHGRVEKREHGHETADDVIQAVVLNTERVEHHPARIKRHRHREQHPRVKRQSVLGNASVCIRFSRHLVANVVIFLRSRRPFIHKIPFNHGLTRQPAGTTRIMLLRQP